MIPTTTAPAKLQAFVSLVNAGLPRQEIMKQLKIKRSTYYLRLKEIRQFTEEARRLERDD